MTKATESKYYMNQFGGLHGSDTLTPVGRIAFVNLAKPNVKFDPPKYGATLLFDKKDETVLKTLKSIQALCNDMAEEFCKILFAREKPKMLYPKFKEAIIAGFAAQPIFRDGDMKEYDGFAGNWYIVAKNDKRPGMSGGIKILDDKMPEEFESGMLVRAQIQPYLDKKGFSYKMRGIRMLADDGIRFSVAPDGASLLAAMDDAVDAVRITAEDVETVEASGLGNAFDTAVSANVAANTAVPGKAANVQAIGATGAALMAAAAKAKPAPAPQSSLDVL